MADDPAKPIDVAAITKTVTEAVTKQITEALAPKLAAIDELAKNQKVLADTLASLPPAGAKEKPADKSADKPAAGDKDETPSADAIAKLVNDGIAAALKVRDDEAAKRADRQKLVEKIAREKLGGDVDLAGSLTGDDEAALQASADRAAAAIKKHKPDFGGAAANGGTPPNGDTKPTVPTNTGLPPGIAKFAAAIKLPE